MVSLIVVAIAVILIVIIIVEFTQPSLCQKCI